MVLSEQMKEYGLMSNLTSVNIRKETLSELKNAIYENYGEVIGRVYEEADEAIRKHIEDLRGEQ